jgi:hypothetical protein
LRITVSGKKARSVDKRFAVDDDHDFVANVTLTSAAELGSADLDAILVTSSRTRIGASCSTWAAQVTGWANVYVNVKNLTNDPMRYSEGTQNRPIQREYYGTAYQAGVTLKF